MLTGIVLILGAITVLLSSYIALRFRTFSAQCGGASGRLSSALSFQLVGEAVIGSGTLVFTVAAHYGWLEGWSIETQSSLRFIMFVATSVTSIHLLRVVRSNHDG